MTKRYPELADENSLLSQSFAVMDTYGTGLGGDMARSMWLKEIYPMGWYVNNSVNRTIDIYHSVDIFFSKDDKRTDVNDQGFNISPIKETCLLQCEFKERCNKGLGCTGSPGMPNWKTKTQELMVINQIPSEQAFEESDIGLDSARSNLVERYLNDLLCARTNKCPGSLEALDLSLDDGEEMNESVNKSSPNEQAVTCNGNREISHSNVTKWPRLLAVEFGEAANHQHQKKHTLEDLPKCFSRDGKKFNLRFVILGGSGHFVTVLCFRNCWMKYDGARGCPGDIKFQTFENDEKGSRLAMAGKHLAMGFYEITEQSNTAPCRQDFGNEWFEPSKILRYEGVPVSFLSRATESWFPLNGHCKDHTDDLASTSTVASGIVDLNNREEQVNNSLPDDTPIKLEKLRKEITSGKKHLPASSVGHGSPAKKIRMTPCSTNKASVGHSGSASNKKTKKKIPSSKSYIDKIPMGFSLRCQPQRAGRKPSCKGCEMEINYDALCLKHKLPKGGPEQLIHEQVNCYHLDSYCIMEMIPKHLSQFLRGKYSDPRLSKMVGEIQWIRKKERQSKMKET
jgi:hypothetical protein